MNPFDAPPSTPAVSYEPPRPPKRRRGRMIGAVAAGAGLVGAGAIGVGALASADDPDSETAATTVEASDGLVDEGRTLSTQGDAAMPWSTLDEDDVRAFQECMGLPDAPFGDDIEQLPALEELFGEDFSLEELFGELEGELPMLGELEGELPMLEELFGELEGELPMLEELFGDDFSLEEWLGELEGEFSTTGAFGITDGDLGAPVLDDLDAMLEGLVVTMGPDGPILVDLGDGDGSVTIERDADSGEVTVTTDGGATLVELDALVEDMIVPLLPGEMQECFDGLAPTEG